MSQRLIRYPQIFVLIGCQVELVSHFQCVPRPRSALHQTAPPRWLNVVLDINGILCQCVHLSSLKKNSAFCRPVDRLFMADIPCKIPPKAVFCRPGVRTFLETISTHVARVVVWSSMKKSTVEAVVDYLFGGLPMPYEILGQESCNMIEVNRGVFLSTPWNPKKEFFLKTLASAVFPLSDGAAVFGVDNTLLIDDSPEKSICNHTGNAIFLESWVKSDRNDTILSTVLTPWLNSLLANCRPGNLRSYVDNHRIGILPLSPHSNLGRYIVEGMAQSRRNLGHTYDTPSFPTSLSR